jgi:hypothetical protein
VCTGGILGVLICPFCCGLVLPSSTLQQSRVCVPIYAILTHEVRHVASTPGSLTVAPNRLSPQWDEADQ